MPIWSRKWSFVDYTVSAAPQDQGVYALWLDNDIVFIGHTGTGENIRTCLLGHFSGTRGGAIRADHYSWEIASNPRERRDEVLRAYVANHGKAPRGNQEAPPR